MTIKVIQHKIDADKVEQVGIPAIHLYEGERVQYKFIDFKNREDFIEKYNKIVKGLGDAHVIGIPPEYWGNKEVEPNMFLRIFYGIRDKIEQCLILQNATVYVMQGGQTVDKIYC